MQKKFASKSGFFDLRVLIALFVVSAAAFVALFASAIPSGLAVETALAEEGPTPTPTPGTVLYDQYDNFATEEPVNIPSQDAETALDFFDSQAADDFIVPAGQTWQVTEVDVLGEYDSRLGRPRRFTFSFTRMAQATCQGCWLPADSRVPIRGATIS